MFKRVNFDGPGDDPDEYWFECNDCEGSGVVQVPIALDVNDTEEGECPTCDGDGFIEGDADDVSDFDNPCEGPR